MINQVFSTPILEFLHSKFLNSGLLPMIQTLPRFVKPILIVCLVLLFLLWITSWNVLQAYQVNPILSTTTPLPVTLVRFENPEKLKIQKSGEKTIIVVTPTYRRLTRIADFTRFANTLSHLTNLHWIVIEDGPTVIPAIQNILERTSLPFTYMAYESPPSFPNRGWFQRNKALNFIREEYKNLTDSDEAVVYFGDDDNAYDLRLFTEYIRNVKRIGMWGVGHVGQSLVESPRVFNNTVIGFDATWSPDRYFAVDMAGFALGLPLILNSTVEFRSSCPSGAGALESCLLEDLGLKREDVEPFGFGKQTDRDVLVWHTKTRIPWIQDFHPSAWDWLFPKPPRTNNYFVEY